MLRHGMNLTRGRRLAIGAVLLAAIYTASVLVWRFVFDSAEAPRLPEMHGLFGGFAMYWWSGAALLVAAACALVLAACGRRRERVREFVVIVSALLSLTGVVALYAPLCVARLTRFGRVRGPYEEPIPAMQLLFASLLFTTALAIGFVAMTQLLRVPANVRASAIATTVVIGMVCGHLIWFFFFIPFRPAWMPPDMPRTISYVSFRPCRGAALFSRGGNLVARIDDLWLHFNDPRDPRSGHATPAISLELEWREGYGWLSLAEASQFRMHAADPKVMDCDARWRADVVAPLPWHSVGSPFQ